MHRVLVRRSVAYVSCIIFCAIVYHVPGSWGIIHMNSSNLTNCTASFTDLSRIMKNLRNAFIYTASTQQRNGNFQQWLPYNALCLGKATPRHCILETMRPPCLGQIQLPPPPGEVSPLCPPSPGRAREGSPYTAPAMRDPSRPHQSHGCWRSRTVPWGRQAPPRLHPGRDALEHPSVARQCGTHQPAGITSHFIGHYNSGFYAELWVKEQPGSLLHSPRSDCKQSFEVPPAKPDPIPGWCRQHRVSLHTLGCSTLSPRSEDAGHLLSFMLIRQCKFLTQQSAGLRDLS